MSLLYKIRWHFAHASRFERFTVATAVVAYGVPGLFVLGVWAGNYMERGLSYGVNAGVNAGNHIVTAGINTVRQWMDPGVPVVMAQVEGTDIFIRMPVPRAPYAPESNKPAFTVASEPETQIATGPSMAPEKQPFIPVVGGKSQAPATDTPALQTASVDTSSHRNDDAWPLLMDVSAASKILHDADPRRFNSLYVQAGVIVTAAKGQNPAISLRQVGCLLMDHIYTIKSSEAYSRVPRDQKQSINTLLRYSAPGC